MAKAMPSAFERFMLGDYEITVLSDGHRAVPDPQSIFGTDRSKEEVEALLAANYLPVDRMQFTFAPTLVNTGDALILFDTGNGEGGRQGGVGQTLANLEASGYYARPGHPCGDHPHASRSYRRIDGRRRAGLSRMPTM